MKSAVKHKQLHFLKGCVKKSDPHHKYNNSDVTYLKLWPQ